MTSIRSLGFVNSYIMPCSTVLSEETRRKLIALGIDPSTVKSEAEAKKLIEKAQKTQPIKVESYPEYDEKTVFGLMNFDGEMNRLILGL